MDDIKQILLEKQAKRYDLLQKLYRAVSGSQSKIIDFPSFAIEHGAGRQEADDILDYFLGERLVDLVADEGAVTLSHRGIVEIEQSMTNPNVSTEHFSTQVIQHFHGSVGAVQNAAHSTANVNQNIGANVLEVISLLQDLRLKFQELPQEKRVEALELVDGLEAEAKAEGRSVARLKAMFSSLLPFVSDVGANVLAATIAQGLGLNS